MPEGHDYFENGVLDVFRGTKQCLPNPVCFMRLNSDNSGITPGWYVEYMDVTTSKVGSQSTHIRFSVQQWLAIDSSPYELHAERNQCSSNIKKSVYSII